MLLILFTIIIATCIAYLYLKQLINNLFYSVPYEPKYIYSYVPIFGFSFEMMKNPIELIHSLYSKYGKAFAIHFASKRIIYLCDEGTYRTKVINSEDITNFDVIIQDVFLKYILVNPQCLLNEESFLMQVEFFRQHLTADGLENLSKAAHDSLLKSMEYDEKLRVHKNDKIANLFDLFLEFMLLGSAGSLFGYSFITEQRNVTPSFFKLYQSFEKALNLDVYDIPFRTIIYRTLFRERKEFINRFSLLKLNNGESELIHALEELFRSNKFKDLYCQNDKNAMHALTLWLAVSITAPMACWSIVDLLLHSKALEAVKQELKENISSSATLISDRKISAKLKVLESCIYETMRRVFNAASMRVAMTDTTIECLDKTKIGVRKGDIIIYPAFLKHLDPKVFGPNPYEYEYDRFVKKPDQPTAPLTMFFGCGIHRCPARAWVVNQIKILVALVIQHMDIEFINMTEKDKEDYRKRLPYDYSRFGSASGAKNGYEHKFNIKYSYKNLHNE